MARQPLPKDTELRGRYRVDTVLGAGGFGITYMGLDLHLGRSVAIKEYFPADHAQREGHYTVRSLDTANRQFFALGRSWFLREARTLAKYHHPNIVGVMDHFEENGTAYMILRFEEGQSLSRWLRTLGRPPTQYEVDGFMLPILSALEAMHSNNDMHRDVAMDNIILRPNGEPVLIDFGSARQAIGAHSRSIDAVVKFGYSPPEQYSVDTRLQGPWSDVYALASTLHLAITGKLPPDAPGRQLDDTYQPLAERGLDEYRIGLLQGIDWGLALRPAERPQSISDWRRTLLQTSDEPLDTDPVELLRQPTQARPATLRTPAPATTANATVAEGTVFIERTAAAGSAPVRGAAAAPSRRPATGPSRVSSSRPAASRPPSSRVGIAPGNGPEQNLASHAAALAPDDARDSAAPRTATGAINLAAWFWEPLLLAAATVCAFLFFRLSDGAAGTASGDVHVTPGQTALVGGYGFCLAALIGRSLLMGDALAGRPRAMIALGLTWLPTLLLSVLAIPFFGFALAMRGTMRPWHATALNIAGGLHILVGVLLIFGGLKASPMFALAASLSLIAIGFLTLLTAREAPQSNSSVDIDA